MPSTDSVLTRRNQLAHLIREGAIDHRVLDVIIPGGIPLADEDQYWDYKASLPTELSGSPSAEAKREYDVKASQIIKDVVSFYNVNGGYLIIGVDDQHLPVGWSFKFDSNDLSKRASSYIKTVIDVKYRVVEHFGKKFGLLLIPERPKTSSPVQFAKSAPEDQNGRRAFLANDIYLRSRDECRKAVSSDDYSTLFRRDRTNLAARPIQTYLENNMPARDPSLLDFVGREEQIDALWRWFTERYTAVKLLSGPGGVGKTSIAWTFCDAVSQFPPEGINKIIWLTAKRRTYAALLGEYVEIAHTHFNNLETLLGAILAELGYPDEEIDKLETRDDLIEEVISAISNFPCLLVVDDVDSLASEQQFDVFRSISTIFDRVIATGGGWARALLTARLTLGAAPGQLMTIGGMPITDFEEYVKSTAAALGAPLSQGKNLENEIKRLHEASSGSPLFAASILRLVSLGESLSSAIRQYKGADGEEVRRFAFERELDALSDSQRRLLFAAINLGDSTFVELLDVTQSNRTLLRDDIGGLRDYHLMAIDSSVEDLARGTSRVSVPAVIVSMSDIIRKKVSDPSRIESSCLRARRQAKQQDTAAGRYIRQVIADWGVEDFDRAVETSQLAARNCADVADIWCILGRSYLKRKRKTDYKAADVAFRKARELGCTRRELLPLWLSAKREIGDWMGVISVIRESEPNLVGGAEIIAVGEAHLALGNEQFRSGSWRSAVSNYFNGAEEMRRAFINSKAHGYVEPLRNLKYDLSTAHVNAVIRSVARDEDKIEVWLAVKQSVEMEVFHRGQILLGARALTEWWSALKRNAGIDDGARKKAQSECRGVERVARKLVEKGGNWVPIATQILDLSAKIS